MREPSNAPAGYEQDFFRWARQQAALLRAQAELHGNAPLDWANLAEEVEGVALRDRRELGSRLQTTMEHLLKLQCSSATLPRTGWQVMVLRERHEIAAILEQSPSLRRSVAALLQRRWAGARADAIYGMLEHGETADAPDSCPYSPREVLDEAFWPEKPGPP